MKKILLASLMLSGCGTTKYVVTPAPTPFLTYQNQELIALGPNGEFIWRVKPEQVVALLVKINEQSAKDLRSCLNPAPKKVEVKKK